MEIGDSKEIPGDSLRTYKAVIKKERLPVFERAAETTGYGIIVTAQAGEEILVKDRGEMGTFHKVKVSPGCVEVAITIPPGQEKNSTEPFYNVVQKLRQSPK